MFKPRNVYLLLAGAAIILTSVVCGYGSAAPPAPASFQTPSGGGAPAAPQALSAATEAAAAPTQAESPTQLPLIIEPTATFVGIPVTGGPGEPQGPAPAIPEMRRLTLEYPAKMRVGDSDRVRLTLEVDTLGNITPTAEVQGNVITGQTVAIPNVYDTHDVIAEARLDLAGVDVRPSEQVTETLLPGESVTFYWSVQPPSAGTYRGTAWLFLNFIDKTTKEESRKALSAQPVEITAGSLFGLDGGLARTAGGVGSVVGAVLGIPFADDILKWVWRRIRQGA